MNTKSKILIFSTSITKKSEIRKVNVLFSEISNGWEWSIDLEDWEKVLRIVNCSLPACDIIEHLESIGINSKELT